ncbi:hypothetical protein F993_02131 [Acinetobacter proteolyticus]|uniref:DUF3885 domain-containing protein n=1 Tax=Acinetobacter proteolyticus TaxID=1776741 RepID=A0ABP2TLJ9_9GAMM|nr:hypothetical protein [Acinetobacter proteolyticus]ENU23262.1 hypothetical protein F993_02131 [Acinetobacter proteolyticus]
MAHSFQVRWDLFYPNKLPISPYLIQDFPQFGFRIHSLPESKRYANTPEEYELLLNRHNKIITDCFGTGTSIFIVSGHYFTASRNNKAYDPAFRLKYQFHLEQEINLTQANPEYYDGEDEDHFFRPCTVEVTWQTNQHNELLRKIADDELRAFMISFEQNIIVAPYDGGIDFIIFDEAKRNDLRNKYRDWLSPRADGL